MKARAWFLVAGAALLLTAAAVEAEPGHIDAAARFLLAWGRGNWEELASLHDDLAQPRPLRRAAAALRRGHRREPRDRPGAAGRQPQQRCPLRVSPGLRLLLPDRL